MQHRTPPSFVGIVALPLLGIAAAEMLHTRGSEPLLFMLPGPIGAIQLFIAQFQSPDASTAQARGERYHRAVRACIAWNQIAVLPLVLTEAGAIIAFRPGVPWQFGCVILAFFAVYIGMRLLSRHYWLRAIES